VLSNPLIENLETYFRRVSNVIYKQGLHLTDFLEPRIRLSYSANRKVTEKVEKHNFLAAMLLAFFDMALFKGLNKSIFDSSPSAL
jgi:hypothetical protein